MAWRNKISCVRHEIWQYCTGQGGDWGLGGGIEELNEDLIRGRFKWHSTNICEYVTKWCCDSRVVDRLAGLQGLSGEHVVDRDSWCLDRGRRVGTREGVPACARPTLSLEVDEEAGVAMSIRN